MDVDRIHKISLATYLESHEELRSGGFTPKGMVATLPQRDPGIALHCLEDLLNYIGFDMAFETEIHTVGRLFGKKKYFASAEAYVTKKSE